MRLREGKRQPAKLWASAGHVEVPLPGSWPDSWPGFFGDSVFGIRAAGVGSREPGCAEDAYLWAALWAVNLSLAAAVQV